MIECFERIRKEFQRALAILVILLCSVLPAGAESATGDTEALRSFLQTHYGVTILMGDECSPFSPEGFVFLITC